MASSKLDPDTVKQRLADYPDWQLEGDTLTRSFRFHDFNAAFAFLAQVALISEKQDHHAEIWNVYNQVSLTLSSHDVGGITERDFRFLDALKDQGY